MSIITIWDGPKWMILCLGKGGQADTTYHEKMIIFESFSPNPFIKQSGSLKFDSTAKNKNLL